MQLSDEALAVAIGILARPAIILALSATSLPPFPRPCKTPAAFHLSPFGQLAWRPPPDPKLS